MLSSRVDCNALASSAVTPAHEDSLDAAFARRATLVASDGYYRILATLRLPSARAEERVGNDAADSRRISPRPFPMTDGSMRGPSALSAKSSASRRLLRRAH